MSTPILDLIAGEVAQILADKGAAPISHFAADTIFLGGDMDFDSLDLATLLVVLEQKTGLDPFRSGFRQFTTVGELAALYAQAGYGS